MCDMTFDGHRRRDHHGDHHDSFIDTSVFCGAWPFRALPHRTPESLKSYLRHRRVTQAWVASSEAILFPDPMQGNIPLFEAIEGDSFFRPVAIIDPSLATWKEDAKKCIEHWGCVAIKIVPNYHQVDLNDDRVDDVARLCGRAGRPLCIQMRMMDERSHHPLMKVAGVDAERIACLAERHRDTRFLLCGLYWREMKTFQQLNNVWVELSFVESGETLIDAVKSMAPERICFGSHSPFFYFEATKAKLDVPPGAFEDDVIEKVVFKNSLRLIG